MMVPSLEQKHAGSWHSAGSHLVARSIGVSVIGAIAENEEQRKSVSRNILKYAINTLNVVSTVVLWSTRGH